MNMRRFTVPFDMEFEDKIIGGKLSLRQFGWLLVPTMYLFIFLSKISSNTGSLPIVSIIIHGSIILLITICALILAFYKKDTLTYDKYLMKKIKFKYRRKEYRFYK